jgi:hypothetical protein
MGEGLTEREDDYQRRATAAAVAAARRIVLGDEAVIPMNTPIGRLSDIEWGWIVAAVLFGWIKTRAEQATVEGLDPELAIRLTGLSPDPWDCGAIAKILPELADTPGIDWNKPLAGWSREMVIQFLARALELVRQAVIARNLGGRGITRNPVPVAARDAMDQQIPF